jgi:hypothetical protein
LTGGQRGLPPCPLFWSAPAERSDDGALAFATRVGFSARLALAKAVSRALALATALHRSGVPPRHVFGVRRQSEATTALWPSLRVWVFRRVWHWPKRCRALSRLPPHSIRAESRRASILECAGRAKRRRRFGLRCACGSSTALRIAQSGVARFRACQRNPEEERGRQSLRNERQETRSDIPQPIR